MKDYDILKGICNKMLLFGLGDHWIEKGVVGRDDNIFYKIYYYSIMLLFAIIAGMELLAALFGHFPEDEKADAITLSVSHVIDLSKIISVLVRGKTLESLIRDTITVCEKYEKPKDMARKYKIIKFSSLAYIFLLYAACAFFIYEGIRKTEDGKSFVVIVTYWPPPHNQSLIAFSARVIMTALIPMLLINVVIVDCFAITFLVIINYKLKTLGKFFRAAATFDKNKSDRENVEIFKEKIYEGVLIHKSIIRIYQKAETVFGVVISLHICQSYGSVVSLLIGLSRPQALTATLKQLSFLVALLLLLGLFMCNQGELSYQAEQLSKPVFYCGWHQHLTPESQSWLRHTLLLTLRMTHRKLGMRAFNLFDITYGSYLSVLNAIYSAFMILRARKSQ